MKKGVRAGSGFHSKAGSQTDSARLAEADRHVAPIHAQGYFYVGYSGIAYFLVFDYSDPLGYYTAVLSDSTLYEKEVEKLYSNMQSLLDEEKIMINGKHVRAQVVGVDIGFRGRASNVFVSFAVVIPAPFRPGLNVYENFYEPEVAEYDYEAYWIFPPGVELVEVDLGSNGETWEVVGERLLVITGRRGTRGSGYEKIVFKLL